MKKFFYLATSLLLLTACSSQEANSPSSEGQGNLSLEQEFDKIESQYEQAAQAASFQAADYPLVNPVSFEMASKYSGQGKLDIQSEQVDLNDDGKNELLIGTKTPTTDSETVTVYLAVYGLVDGKIVDLTKDLLKEKSDNFIAIYKNNRLRLDQAQADGKMINAVYELTETGFKELLYIEVDASQSSEIDDIKISDRDGKLYRKSEVEPKIIEVIGHPLDQDMFK